MDQFDILKIIFGWVLIILTATQFVPQVIKSLKTKSMKDLSWGTFILTVITSTLWFLYGTWHGSFEIIAANAVVNISCLAILMQKYFSEKPKVGFRAAAFAGIFVILIAIAIVVQSPLLRQALGWVAVSLNLMQFVPQAIKSLRTKSTRDLSWWSFIQTFIVSILWTLYGIGNKLPEVIVTNLFNNIVIDAILVRKYLSEKKGTQIK